MVTRPSVGGAGQGPIANLAGGAQADPKSTRGSASQGDFTSRRLREPGAGRKGRPRHRESARPPEGAPEPFAGAEDVPVRVMKEYLAETRRMATTLHQSIFEMRRARVLA